MCLCTSPLALPTRSDIGVGALTVGAGVVTDGVVTVNIFFLDAKIKLTVSHKTNTRLARRLRMARRVLVRIISRPRKRLIIFKTGAASYCKTKRRRARRSQRLVFVSEESFEIFFTFCIDTKFLDFKKNVSQFASNMRTLDDNILSLSLSLSRSYY